ncbi:MAG: RNA polymerase sigma factor [Pseudomonadales bacterium]
MQDALENNPTVSRRELERLHEACFAWALLLTDHDRSAAEDVLQQAYLLVVSGRARFRERSSLKTWLFGVLRNVARRAHRRRRLYRMLALRLDTAEEPEEPGEPADPRLQSALAELPPRQRELLGLVFYADLSIEQAAAVLGISIGSARTHYHRAKQNLRRRLEVDDDR